jgi:hypothetical protein
VTLTSTRASHSQRNGNVSGPRLLSVALLFVVLLPAAVNAQDGAASFGARWPAQHDTALDSDPGSDLASTDAKRSRRFALPAHSKVWSLPRSSPPSSTFEEYEGRPVVSVEIVFEGSPADPAAEAEFLSIIRVLPNTEFSAVVVRDSLQGLFDSERVANARVEVLDAGSRSGPLRLRFVIKRQVQIGDIKFDLTPPTGTPSVATDSHPQRRSPAGVSARSRLLQCRGRVC